MYFRDTVLILISNTWYRYSMYIHDIGNINSNLVEKYYGRILQSFLWRETETPNIKVRIDSDNNIIMIPDYHYEYSDIDSTDTTIATFTFIDSFLD